MGHAQENEALNDQTSPENLDFSKIKDGDLEEIRKYLQKDYWEEGRSKGISGYEAENLDWWWINRWLQCFTQVFPVRDKVMLDLGCGYGSMVAGFVTWGADAYGIDISDYAVQKGRSIDYLKERLFQGSIHDLSRWGDDTFDFLYSNQVLEHLPEQYCDDLVKEMRRVLRKKGSCWISMVTSAEENGLRGADDSDETHINIHSMDWWRKKFSSAGFSENKKLKAQLENTRTGYDGFNYFEEYGWHNIVLQ